MKIKYTLAVSMLAFLGLASCEMKDEILDKNKITGDTGFLEMGVSVQSGTTKSGGVEDGGAGTDPNAPKDASNFTVEIVQTEGGEYNKTYPTYADLQKENPLELPVGKYTVSAHTPGEIQPVMDEPYYGGQFDQLNIKKDITSEANVVCKMENTKIQIIYDPEFNSTFKTWKITITDGSSHILTFDETDLNPKPKYWLIEDNVSEIKVSINAVTVGGDKVEEFRSITKPEGTGSEFWAGSDALNITMKPGEPTDPENPNGIGIDIIVDVTFEGSEETVEIPVDGEDGGEEPVDPPVEGDGPTITIPQAVYTLPEDTLKKADVLIKADAGIQSVKVQIVGGNDMFVGIIADMFGAEPFELIKNATLAPVFAEMGITTPNVGDTKYTFPVAAFFDILSAMQATTNPDGHVFNIIVEDKNAKSATDKISVKVIE